MKHWLATLHEFFLDQEPFVVATVTAFHGNSPEAPGVALLHSATKSQSFIKSEHRQQQMCTTATQLLATKAVYQTEVIPLGRVAGGENGYCEVIYEYFDGHPYPQWLTSLRAHYRDGVSCNLVREFCRLQNRVIHTEVLQNQDHTHYRALSNKHLNCSITSVGHSLILKRTLRHNSIKITLVGDHAVADAIQRQCEHLPVELKRVNSLDQNALPAGVIIIMTNDHELDYHYCKIAIQHACGPGNFIGCIGSTRKAHIFQTRLKQAGISHEQLNLLHMPVGVAEINGKQTSIVAASIIAQILMHHHW